MTAIFAPSASVHSPSIASAYFVGAGGPEAHRRLSVPSSSICLPVSELIWARNSSRPGKSASRSFSRRPLSRSSSGRNSGSFIRLPPISIDNLEAGAPMLIFIVAYLGEELPDVCLDESFDKLKRSASVTLRVVPVAQLTLESFERVVNDGAIAGAVHKLPHAAGDRAVAADHVREALAGVRAVVVYRAFVA